MIQKLPSNSTQKSEVAFRDTPEYCVIEVAADGFITVYGPEHLRVKIINRPVASSAEAGSIVDQLIDAVLPKKYRDVFWPGMQRASGMPRKLTGKDMQRIKARLQLCQVAGGRGMSSEAANILQILEM